MVRKKLVSRSRSSHYNEDGHEILDPTPIVENVTPRPPTMQERVRMAIQQELSLKASQEGFETLEESNDFDVDDGFEVDDPISPYEQVEMVPEYLEDEIKEITPEPPADPEGSSPAVKAQDTSEGKTEEKVEKPII